MRFTSVLTGVVCLAFGAFAQGNGNGASARDQQPGADANGKVIHETRTSSHASVNAAASSTIVYHGGPVLLGTTRMYCIFYGNWSNAGQSILLDFASHIGGSPYFNINTTYYNASNVKVSNSVALGGSALDAYSKGTTLNDSGVQSVVSSAIASGKLPKDTNGVYFVLGSPDVKESSGFCTQYCGWHTHGTISGSDIKYAFIGNPASQCPASCAEQTSSSPNGDIGVDAMISIVAHELEEAVTDPGLNAWYDRRGAENADKCAWTFGAMSTASNGSKYNVTLGSRQYLIQQNWVNSGGGFCAMSH